MKIIVQIFILTLFSHLSSQVFSEYSYAGANQAAMVGTINSNISNENGIFQNPASIAGLEDNVLIAGKANIFNQPYLPYQYIGLVFNSIGISFQSLSTENEQVQLSSEKAISLNKGFFLQKDKNSCIAMGLRINAFFWEQGRSAGASGDGTDGFGGTEKSTLGLDFGVIGGLRDKYWVGGYLSNINSPVIATQNLPRKISVSLGFNPFDQVYTNLSMERLLGRDDRQVKLGFKYNISDYFTVLSGAQSNPNRFGLGLEFSIKKITLSYSILTHHVMSATHNIEFKIK